MTVFAETPAANKSGGCDWLAIWQHIYDTGRTQARVFVHMLLTASFNH
jgi:hypothetical protein